MADIKKQHFNIQPPRNSTKSVYTYLLIHPDWLKGSPGNVDGHELGGHADASPENNGSLVRRATEEPQAGRGSRPDQTRGGHVAPDWSICCPKPRDGASSRRRAD